jgi:hypothetical protein
VGYSWKYSASVCEAFPCCVFGRRVGGLRKTATKRAVSWSGIHFSLLRVWQTGWWATRDSDEAGGVMEWDPLFLAACLADRLVGYAKRRRSGRCDGVGSGFSLLRVWQTGWWATQNGDEAGGVMEWDLVFPCCVFGRRVGRLRRTATKQAV